MKKYLLTGALLLALYAASFAWGAAAASAATVTAPGIGTTGNTALDACVSSGLTTINYGGQNGLLACTYYSGPAPAHWVVDNAGQGSAWGPATTINTACGASNQAIVQQWASDNDGTDAGGNPPVYLALGQASLSDGSSVCVYALNSGWIYTTSTGEFDTTADAGATWSVPAPPAPPEPPAVTTVALDDRSQSALDASTAGVWTLVGATVCIFGLSFWRRLFPVRI